MAGKTTLVHLAPRLEVKPSKQEGIVLFDVDNGYPQRCKILTGGSVSAQSCLRLLKNFLKGEGFEDKELGNKIMGANQETMNELLGLSADDLADHNGIAIHVQYNGMLEPVSYSVVEFQNCRLTTNDNEEHPNKIAIHPDWGRIYSKKVRKDDIEYVDKFTTDKKTIQQQIADAGGFSRWNGHILWFSRAGRNKYPTPCYDPVLNDIETEAEIAEGKKSDVLTGFMAPYIAKFKQKFEGNDREEMRSNLEEFQGNKFRGRIMMIDDVTEENEPVFEKLDPVNNDRLFEYTETSIADNIRRSFLAPKELTGHEYTTGFQSDKIQQARDYYNSITDPDRDILEAQWKKVLEVGGRVFNTKIKKLYVNVSQ